MTENSNNTDNGNTKNIVVIGASAAGMKAACRARRLIPGANVTVLEEGEYISYAACGLPYFLSGDIDSFDELRKTPYGMIKDPDYFSTVKDVTVRTNIKAVKINRESRSVLCESASTGEKLEIKYDYLVLATGARPIIPNIPGHDLEGVCTFKTAEETIRLKKECETGKIGKVALIGAGFIGLELCEAFGALWGIDVTLFEIKDHILPGILDPEMAYSVEKMLIEEGVEVNTGSSCEQIQSVENGLAILTDRGRHPKTFDRIIFGAGLRPDNKLAMEAGIETGITGGIKVDGSLQTSDPNIFAGGDCMEYTHKITGKPVLVPLGSLANRTGRVIGENIAGKKRQFGPVNGSTVLKVFDWNIAATGLNLNNAGTAGFETCEIWGTFEDKAHYYPDPENILVKMNVDRKTERILGVQAAGKGDVVRRIDAASAMMQSQATLSDFINFEPAYAPPYSGPLDPLHFLAFTADAVINDGLEMVSPALMGKLNEWDSVVLDVRTETEKESMPLPEGNYTVFDIPLDRLRERINELPREKKLLIICQRGTRSYEAVRLLREKGFRECCFLGGGMLFARIYIGEN